MDGDLLRIVSGDPTDEELVALVGVLHLIAAREPEDHGTRVPASDWKPTGYQSPLSWSSTLIR